ncbi:hypothetical protein KC332_g2110 [Hortaea werneckii]|uniref:Calcineurin-like phosphoesterase domain-containing protein n=2 Tax=Hortaea werneckii TaxID=91943 RepID=A0A3M7J3G5_HORWE|nr:hypothetical protein KC350_g13611 [Hortaea werneckii]OTA39894.1 hypothetical protein BTJ68_00196 [Hortaea werneckii EXF-2000]KAI6834979.1 hypothetical protein KC342_g6007 [Hortaea werneckii]KAI6847784.1 hypothetical protein KC358_g2157 [Hortaea werneckii]KAI6941892.1 hypothetical protein KC341_g2592 [Hortaea werneckii]
MEQRLLELRGLPFFHNDQVYFYVNPGHGTVRACAIDFYSAHDWDVAQHNAAHTEDLEWLNDQVTSETTANNNIMILTHWSPTTDLRSLDPKHLGNDNPIGCAFSTDLSGQKCFESEKVRVWAFGHTHYNCSFEIERGECAPLKVVTNQRGYYFAQAAGFDEEKVVDLAQHAPGSS